MGNNLSKPIRQVGGATQGTLCAASSGNDNDNGDSDDEESVPELRPEETFETTEYDQGYPVPF